MYSPTPVILLDESGNPYSSANLAQDSTFAQVLSPTTSLGALNALLALTPGRKGTAIIQVSGAFVATLSLLGTLDGTNYVTFGATPQFLNLNTGAYTATITAAGVYQTSMNGLVGAQIKVTAYTSGAASVTASLTDAPAMIALDAAIPAGGNTIGGVNIANVAIKASGTSPATTDSSLTVTQSPNYAASAAAHYLTTAATTNGTSVKTSAGAVFELDVTNLSAATVYLKLYNKASVPTVGTDNPIVIIPIAANTTFVQEFGQYGKRFTGGIAYAITGAAAISDTTAITAGNLVGITYI